MHIVAAEESSTEGDAFGASHLQKRRLGRVLQLGELLLLLELQGGATRCSCHRSLARVEEGDCPNP